WQDRIQKASKDLTTAHRHLEAVVWYCEKAIEDARATGELDEEVVRELIRMGQNLGSCAFWYDAEKVFKLAKQVALQMFDPQSSVTGDAFEMESYSLMAQYRFPEAIEVMKESVRLAKQGATPSFNEVVKRTRKLAICMNETGNNIAAKQVIEDLIQWLPEDFALMPVLRQERQTYETQKTDMFVPFDRRFKFEEIEIDEEVSQSARKSLGLAILKLRERYAWTQAELATRTSTTEEFVGSVERGEQALSLSDTAAFAEVFGMSTQDLVSFTFAD
ncbi:MAG: helix-turn-helix transcriptional regulator, partial [Cyanobacteria bacterium]|nr:helix-turn-helix transcriptional regulator [Cyanobacteriota bacterium]